MNGFAFGHPAALSMLAAVPAIAALFVYADRRRAAALLRFSAANVRNPVDPRKRSRKRIAMLVALSLLIVALARPAWDQGPPAPTPKTSDVVFLLDVSRSMLASDALPTRLDRAKGIVASLVQHFKTERVALVVFAGNCAVQCPLTIDYSYFRERLDAADNESATRGGTRIGDAISFAVNTAFDDVERGRKHLVLLTDGGDQDSSPGNAAQFATARKVRVVAIGIGDAREGAVVPISAVDRAPFLYRGNPVTTRLESGGLENLAHLNLGGIYLPVGTGAIDSGQVYRQYLAATSPTVSGPSSKRTDGYPFVLIVVVLLLVVESAAGERRAQVAALVLFLACSLRASDDSGTVVELVATGNQAFQRGDYSTALHFYRRANSTAPNSPEVLFDLGLAFYRLELYGESAGAYERAYAASHNPKFRAQCKLGQANATYRRAMTLQRHLFEFQQALTLTLPMYREALSLDPTLLDCKYNIEVVKRKLHELDGPMRAANSRYMLQSRQDLMRKQNVEAEQILDENRNAKKTRGQVGRPSIPTDW